MANKYPYNLGELLEHELADRALDSWKAMCIEGKKEKPDFDIYYRMQGQKDMCVLMLSYLKSQERAYKK